MSKAVFASDCKVKSFHEAIGSLNSGPDGGARSGSSRMNSTAKSIYEAAKEEGFAAGRAEGLALGQATGEALARNEFEENHQLAILQFRDALEQFVFRAETAIDDWFARSEESLSTLSVQIARRAICQELEHSRDSIVPMTQQALAEVRHGTSLRVRVNPFDVSILESRRQDILGAVSGVKGLEIVADNSIESGCEIETEGGLVDARVESYLDRLEKEAA